ncbi:hypothetical protein B9Z55_004424 [Caenorhabditis nigoni]|uniref:Fibrillar collagen NC1 domain-containing protein n=1 Tax=Caenorhabditis nigoni TaxID=1611254 RepID=A0A2G5UWH8_9PELO|nr:hypothetical protein B9Z55_004424 [Caenorhabditis nigoni]
MEINADLDEKLTRIRSLDFDNQEVIKRLKELLEKANNLYQLIASKYTEESQVDRNLLTLFQEFLKGNTWIHDHNPKDFKTHPSNPDKNISILEYNLLDIRDLVKEMDLDNVRKVFGGTLEKMDEPKQFLECYSNLNTTSSDTKELLALPGKVWNFDPKVLEGTVEMIGMFKDAYKMVEEIKEWKVASNPEIENFPFDGEDVKAVSDGINVLETIRNVQNGWKMMKTLDIGNSGIKEPWDLLDFSLSQFFEILSNQKIWSLSNVIFPTNLPIDTIRTFIQDEYLENQRNDILNFLREIQKLENDFPEYPNKLYKLNKAMSEMREWENGKMIPVKKMVDCFEIECDVSLEVPGSSK